MFVFRVEHVREICQDEFYGVGGQSIIGHGPFVGCKNPGPVPNFGGYGNPPVTLAEYEHCAVTAEQFSSWVDYELVPDQCRYFDSDYCSGSAQCWECATYVKELQLYPGWHLLAYWLEDSSVGIDWREDNDQICFNPQFAIALGTVKVSEVFEFCTV